MIPVQTNAILQRLAASERNKGIQERLEILTIVRTALS